MWTAIADLSPSRVLLARLLGQIWPGAYFSSFAPLRLQNVPRQQLPSPQWVRVRNRLAGVCGSDLHLIYGDGDFRIAPAAVPGHERSYVGHEVVGEVIEVGDDVQRLRVGDRVVLQYGPNCISSGAQPPCRSCASGDYTLCERGSLPGPEPMGGGWSEEMLVHEQQLFLVPPDMSDEQAVMLEPTAVAVHAVLRCLPRSGDRVLIIGAGAIGLLTLQVIRALVPQAEVSVMARHPFQVEQATRMGAAHIIYEQDSYAGVQRATQAQLYRRVPGNTMLLGGYDVIFDAVGRSKTLHHALRWTRAQGAVVLVGLSLHMMHIDLTPVWYQEINVIGTRSHGMELWPLGSHTRYPSFEVAEELMMREQIRPELLITHRFALNNYRHALTTASGKAQSRALKVVFDYSLLPPSVVPNVRASARRPVVASPIDQLLAQTAQSESQEGHDVQHFSPVPAPQEEPISPTAMSMPATRADRMTQTSDGNDVTEPPNDVVTMPNDDEGATARERFAPIVSLPQLTTSPEREIAAEEVEAQQPETLSAVFYDERDQTQSDFGVEQEPFEPMDTEMMVTDESHDTLFATEEPFVPQERRQQPRRRKGVPQR